MTLSSMVVSRDWQEVSVLECILGGLHMNVEVEGEPQQALSRLNKSKIDALIVDCDLSGTTQFLNELRDDPRRANTVPLVIMGGPKSDRTLDETGALFAFEKPISVEQAVRTLSAARNMILDGRLRYHRAGVEVPVSLRLNSKENIEGRLVNLSQGGLQICTDTALGTMKPMQVSFKLPGTKSAVKTKGEVAWQDKLGNVGIRFVDLAPRQRHGLQVWLAQQYFAN
ncbi:MAG TPA: PilZ domain-containing protein [Candidatus Sulfotelmatobacter sp.]